MKFAEVIRNPGRGNVRSRERSGTRRRGIKCYRPEQLDPVGKSWGVGIVRPLAAGLAAAIMIALGAGLLVVLWLVVTVSIAVHEIAHAAVARREGLGAEAVVVGLGPALVSGSIAGTEWRVCLLPVAGWVSLSKASLPPRHALRLARTAVAGPIANLLLGLLLAVGVLLCIRGPVHTEFRDVVETSSIAGKWAVPIAGSAPTIQELIHSWGTERPGVASAAAGENVWPVELLRTAPENVDRYGVRWILAFAVLLNMSVAGFNLLPVWGLDGYRVLRETLRYRKYRSRGGTASVGPIVTFVATATVCVLLVSVGASFGGVGAR